MGKVTITRERAGNRHWLVRCTSCETSDLFGWDPWARAVDWRNAMLVAELHRELHAARDCASCNRPARIPKPQALTKGFLRLGNEVYMAGPTGWTLVGAPSSDRS